MTRFLRIDWLDATDTSRHVAVQFVPDIAAGVTSKDVVELIAYTLADEPGILSGQTIEAIETGSRIGIALAVDRTAYARRQTSIDFSALRSTGSPVAITVTAPVSVTLPAPPVVDVELLRTPERKIEFERDQDGHITSAFAVDL